MSQPQAEPQPQPQPKTEAGGRTETQVRLLEHYGFCVLRGAARTLMPDLESAFEALLPEAPDAPTERLTRFHAAERDERMRSILQVPEMARLLTGTGATSMVSSDVNVLVGDSYWHSDGFYDEGLYLRAVIYGEPVDGSSGALRVMPASHRSETGWSGDPVRLLMQHESDLGLRGDEVPATVIASEPGDIVVFNTNILHSAWNGRRRRQWAWNFARKPVTDSERRAASQYVLNRFVSGTVRFS
ncbi:phytanoyl-CoA dioxygenase family protein [Streptomyces sp. NPDC127033]|uniref:phytanoyl-CoA dioxygenase family protein n=1 Tax=Streptomyces sp. NPDC127033 TaxID=3347110 RepID=UPI0036495267